MKITLFVAWKWWSSIRLQIQVQPQQRQWWPLQSRSRSSSTDLTSNSWIKSMNSTESSFISLNHQGKLLFIIFKWQPWLTSHLIFKKIETGTPDNRHTSYEVMEFILCGHLTHEFTFKINGNPEWPLLLKDNIYWPLWSFIWK